MDWGMVAGLVAATALAVKLVDRVFGPRDVAVRDLAKQLQAHEVSDASAFAELRASLAAISRDQVGIENRIAMGIDAVRVDVRNAAAERMQSLDNMRNEIRGVNERIDKIFEVRGQ